VLFTVTEVQKISERVFTRYENCWLCLGPNRLDHFGHWFEIKVQVESLEIRKHTVRAPKLEKSKIMVEYELIEFKTHRMNKLDSNIDWEEKPNLT
jgi:hypothetical protein